MDKEIIQANRRYLRSVDHWIADEDYYNSRGRYGCPPHVLPLLNLPLDEQPTYTDLLVHAARRLRAPVRYLELGVSVGKNLYVLANALENAVLVGFDWERINPLLARQFESIGALGRMRYYRHRSNEIAYLEGDISRIANWDALAALRFNLVFSDACHQPEMLRHEWRMFERYGLLDRAGFVMVWDDLDRLASGSVTQAFEEIAATMRRRYRLAAAASFRLELNGWLGQHEHRHTIGVVSSIGLTPADFQ
jgi:predicted O-methyltransferase YrrM